MPTLLFSIIFVYAAELLPLSVEAKRQTIIELFVLTFVVPAGTIVLLFVSGIIPSLNLMHRKERVIPAFITSLIYTGIYYLFVNYLNANRLLILFMGTISFSVVMLSVISFSIKLSLHTSGITGIVGILLALIYRNQNLSALLMPIVFLIAAGGIVASARLYLNAHSGPQVLLGAVAGFAFGFFPIAYFY
jgi:hypothetical protein